MQSSRQPIEWTEVKIRVPWGHIAGKWWGSKDVRPILALHGWQDNAGTFDTLIPLLPAHFSFLAIDLPGHGYSSFLPEGMLYHMIDFIHVIIRVMEEMKWSKVSILGHSMGGVLGLWFAGMFPDKIDLLIAIDILKPYQQLKEQYWNVSARKIANSILTDKRNNSENEPPSYSYSECVDRLLASTKSTDESNWSYVLKRNLKESKKNPGKYYFSRDGRLKYINFGIWPQEIYVELAHRIHLPYLFVKALDSYRSDDSSQHLLETIGVLKKNPLFEYREVRGGHHVHLNEPKNVSGLIETFLNKHKLSDNQVNSRL